MGARLAVDSSWRIESNCDDPALVEVTPVLVVRVVDE